MAVFLSAVLQPTAMHFDPTLSTSSIIVKFIVDEKYYGNLVTELGFISQEVTR